MRYELTTRIAFVHLKTPHAVPGTTNAKYSVVCLIPVDDRRVAEIQNIIQTKLQEKWPAGAPAKLFLALKNGEEVFPDDPSFKGMMIMNATSAEPVPVADAAGIIIDASQFYSGCTAKVFVNFYSYDLVNKGVSAGLNGVQFVADGARMDGRPTPEQMFAPVAGAPAAVAPAAVAPAAVAPAAVAPAAIPPTQ